ncbi:hypothetical protein [Nocardia tengchongensis]|uniref:hypothetical protein n=1 Tax=Nocardia tengchongensis TaxID=2055889 RepID=UPI003678E601
MNITITSMEYRRDNGPFGIERHGYTATYSRDGYSYSVSQLEGEQPGWGIDSMLGPYSHPHFVHSFGERPARPVPADIAAELNTHRDAARTVRLNNAPALIAAVPSLLTAHDYTSLTLPALVVALLIPAEPGWWTVERVGLFDTGPFGSYESRPLTADSDATRSVALIIYPDTTTRDRHEELVRQLDVEFDGLGIPLGASYTATSSNPGAPVWSLDNRRRLGTVPTLTTPDNPIFQLETPVTAQPLPLTTTAR